MNVPKIENVDELKEAIESLAAACFNKSNKLDLQGDVSGARAWSTVARSLKDIADHAERRRDRLDV